MKWRHPTRWVGLLSWVRPDSSMIDSLDCVDIHDALLHAQRPLTGGRWAWSRPCRRGESRLADGLARGETVRQVSQQSGCVRALCCPLGSPHSTVSSPGPWPMPVSTSSATDPMLWEGALGRPSIRDGRLEIIIERDLGGCGPRK